ncbi:hypothetical protein B0H19DRAFT_1234235 [Mycena capillaripes]|nr:hypothetical protein B0H19DRAFT_1234235 [Mycena capillaripes]
MRDVTKLTPPKPIGASIGAAGGRQSGRQRASLGVTWRHWRHFHQARRHGLAKKSQPQPRTRSYARRVVTESLRFMEHTPLPDGRAYKNNADCKLTHFGGEKRCKVLVIEWVQSAITKNHLKSAQNDQRLTPAQTFTAQDISWYNTSRVLVAPQLIGPENQGNSQLPKLSGKDTVKTLRMPVGCAYDKVFLRKLNARVVVLSGYIFFASIPSLERVLLASPVAASCFILDLTHAHRIETAVARVLLRCVRELGLKDSVLVVCGVHEGGELHADFIRAKVPLGFGFDNRDFAACGGGWLHPHYAERRHPVADPVASGGSFWVWCTSFEAPPAPHASGATGWLPVAHRKVSNTAQSGPGIAAFETRKACLVWCQREREKRLLAASNAEGLDDQEKDTALRELCGFFDLEPSTVLGASTVDLLQSSTISRLIEAGGRDSVYLLGDVIRGTAIALIVEGEIDVRVAAAPSTADTLVSLPSVQRMLAMVPHEALPAARAHLSGSSSRGSASTRVLKAGDVLNGAEVAVSRTGTVVVELVGGERVMAWAQAKLETRTDTAA